MCVFLLQVTTLVSSKSAQKQRKGRSKRAHVLVAAVEKATENFVEKGEIIAAENPEIRYREMLEAFFLLGKGRALYRNPGLLLLCNQCWGAGAESRGAEIKLPVGAVAEITNQKTKNKLL
jgi:hypothetical protein